MLTSKESQTSLCLSTGQFKSSFSKRNKKLSQEKSNNVIQRALKAFKEEN